MELDDKNLLGSPSDTRKFAGLVVNEKVPSTLQPNLQQRLLEQGIEVRRKEGPDSTPRRQLRKTMMVRIGGATLEEGQKRPNVSSFGQRLDEKLKRQ
ncbi:MAG TPA: hypothetical protein VGB70_09145 [Allosphingosinicella sp.]